MKPRFNFISMVLTLFTLSLIAQPSSDYKLVFSDSFNDASIDGNAWWKAGTSGCVTHGEEECEEDMWYKSENVTETGGKLKLTAKVDPTTCGGKFKQFSSGWVQTAAQFKYGYYEVRAKVPEDNGFWPAFWFWSGYNNSSYQEVDAFEFCGCDCGEYQAGAFYETDNNGVLGDNIQHTSSDINVGNNACNNFNTYGVEWTSSHLKFYLNGTLKSTQSNVNNHDPLSLILNLAVGGCYGGCGSTYCPPASWDTDGSCHVTCQTDFPKTFEIDWIRGFQKENQAVYINGVNALCLNDSYIFRTPKYPNATYNWSGTSGLQINPSPWLDTVGGLWRTAVVTGISAGLQTITLTVSFPSGYVETETYNVSVQNGPPSSPTSIVFVPDANGCCYNFYSSVVNGATSYIWTINNNYTYTTSSNHSHECLFGGNVTVSVVAQNSCGTSSAYSKTEYLPRLTCGHRLVIFPNPASSLITLKFLNNEDIEVPEINGIVTITDEFGNKVLEKAIERNLEEIEIQNIQNGLYNVMFQNDLSILNATFLKNDGF